MEIFIFFSGGLTILYNQGNLGNKKPINVDITSQKIPSEIAIRGQKWGENMISSNVQVFMPL